MHWHLIFFLGIFQIATTAADLVHTGEGKVNGRYLAAPLVVCTDVPKRAVVQMVAALPSSLHVGLLLLLVYLASILYDVLIVGDGLREVSCPNRFVSFMQ